MSGINRELSSVKVNDIFDELSDENQQLLDQLMIANKCLIVLTKFKTFVDSVFNNYKIYFNSNDLKTFDSLTQEVDNVFNQIPEKNMDSDDDSMVGDYENKSDDNNSNQLKIELCSTVNEEPHGTEVDLYSSGTSSVTTKPVIQIQVPEVIPESVEKLTKNPINTKPKPNVGTRLKDSHPFKCNSCNNSYSKEKSLNIHIKRSHFFNSNSKSYKFDEKSGQYRCLFNGCDYRTKFNKYIVNHMNKHNGFKPFTCEFISCGKTFVNESSFKEHMDSVHKDLKTFKCNIVGCQYQTMDNLQLINHKLTTVHTPVKLFACSICLSEFDSYRSLNIHIRDVHETDRNSFKCQFPGCEEGFQREPDLRVHYKLKHLKVQQPIPIKYEEPECFIIDD